MTLLPLFIALSLQTTPIAQEDVRELCSAQNLGQAAYADCLRRKVAESEVIMRAATLRATKRIDVWDEDKPYVAQAKAALTASGAPFARYRAAQCAFAASMSGGGAGNSREVGRLACVYEVNMRRAAMLDALTGKLPAR